jgi:GH15 family glucan-1,4-alpha-glucosidase
MQTSRSCSSANAHSKPLEDYGLMGNMNSAALVSRDGSIDWLCLPRFDSAACFAALLGDPDHGRWRISPEDETCRISRRYLPGTAVLETTFETPNEGTVTLTDFMPLTEDEEKIDVVRIVDGVSGRVRMNMELVLRFNYGQAAPWVRHRDYGLSAVCGPDAIELHTDLPLHGRKMMTHASFMVEEGQSVPFTLSYYRSHKAPRLVSDRTECLNRTVSWWREWSSRCGFDADSAWHEAVLRSLITLKLLTFRTTGGIVAAPTTSLPEAIGGSRNWDYRYCWIRDSTLTLSALLNGGYREEAEAWREWLLRAAGGDPKQLRVMYGISGERWLPEIEVPWLPGYEGSLPVRVGNGAADQSQTDVYGELMDVLHAARDAKLSMLDEAWEFQRALLSHVEKVWREPDHGIWEVRGPPRAFTHSRLMCWVAFDRAVKSCEHFGLEGPGGRWRAVRDEIRADILEHGFDREKNSFVQHYGSDALDASLLLIPQVGFLPADDRRVRGTVAAIERELLQDGFVLRYSTTQVDDGVEGREGAFLACSFWLADAYVMLGRMGEAHKLFERLLALRNDLGLLAEEYDPVAQRLCGNFPQAFSHVGVVNTACNLVDAHGPATQPSIRVGPTGGASRNGKDADVFPNRHRQK